MGGSGFTMSRSGLNMNGSGLKMSGSGIGQSGNRWESAPNEWKWVGAQFSITHMCQTAGKEARLIKKINKLLSSWSLLLQGVP